MNQVEELEAAILARANRLAAEYKQRAERSRDNILSSASERLHLREEREVLLAKAKAERAYRRRVQANELKLHKEMDHLRWNLVTGVQAQLTGRMSALCADREQYRPLLQTLLAKSAALIEKRELVAEVNAQDLEWLQPDWSEFTAGIAGKRIELSRTPIRTIGGILVRSHDNRIRVDNTFEGRLERLAGQLHQTIIERLLPEGRERAL
ncbi:MAG: V-type ATP synthase subunit E [Gammaproteobacteria bacterium]|nr:V-type ATP synthase subunit E [Gammaproteobacteria bacterium]